MEDKTKAFITGVVAVFSFTVEPILHELHPEKGPHSEKLTIAPRPFVLPPDAHTHEEHRVPSPLYQNLVVVNSTSSSSTSIATRIF